MRRSVGRVRTWTVAHAEVERERTRELARIGNNLNQIARWANTHKGPVEAVEVIGHLIAIERALAGAGPPRVPGSRCSLSSWPAGPARPVRRPTTFSVGGTRPGSRAKASRSSGEIPTRWPPWRTRWRSSTKYTSGVIAWAPEDAPTDDQIGEVLDEFERTAWAGLEPDRYAWAAVLHRERGGGAHVHVLAARCDLETGRSLNIAPPGWEKTFGPLRDAVNAEHGWSRPDDPARARVQQPGHRAYIEAARLRAGLGLESSPRDLIHDTTCSSVSGTARCGHPADVVAALREAGLEVPRQGQDYLTALDPTTGDRWRLKRRAIRT